MKRAYAQHPLSLKRLKTPPQWKPIADRKPGLVARTGKAVRRLTENSAAYIAEIDPIRGDSELLRTNDFISAVDKSGFREKIGFVFPNETTMR